MLKIETKGGYGMSEVADFHMLNGETITSIVHLSNNQFLCTVLSGSLYLINTATKTTSCYSQKYGGEKV